MGRAEWPGNCPGPELELVEPRAASITRAILENLRFRRFTTEAQLSLLTEPHTASGPYQAAPARLAPRTSRSKPLGTSISTSSVDTMLAPVHPDDDLVRIEHDMPRDHGEDFCPQQSQQIRLAAQAAFMRQQNLQPFPCNRRGSIAAAEAAAADSVMRPSVPAAGSSGPCVRPAPSWRRFRPSGGARRRYRRGPARWRRCSA